MKLYVDRRTAPPVFVQTLRTSRAAELYVCRVAVIFWYRCFASSATVTLSSTFLCTHTHTRLTALFPGLPRLAGSRKVKPIWILLKQETVSGSGISWAYASLHLTPDRQRHQQPTSQFFTGRMPFVLPNQQRQSTEVLVQTYAYLFAQYLDPITAQ